jgi:hypothetical protein
MVLGERLCYIVLYTCKMESIRSYRWIQGRLLLLLGFVKIRSSQSLSNHLPWESRGKYFDSCIHLTKYDHEMRLDSDCVLQNYSVLLI